MAVTDWKSPGSTGTVNSGAQTDWTNPGNITASDDAYAVSGGGAGDSAWLRAYNFGFTTADVPDGSTILGIEVEVERKCESDGTRDAEASVSLDGTTAGETATDPDSPLPLSDDVATFTQSDAADPLWGFAVTTADIYDAAFSAFYRGGPGGEDISVDRIRVRIRYAVDFSMTAETGVFALTGQDALVSAVRSMTADTAVGSDRLAQLAAALAGSAKSGIWMPETRANLRQTSTGLTPVGAADPVGFVADVKDFGGLDLDAWLAEATDIVDTGNTAAGWVAYGTNTVEDDAGAVKITYVDDAKGAYLQLDQAGGLSADLPINTYYEITAELKINTGSANVVSLNFNVDTSTAISSTTYVPVKWILQTRSTPLTHYIRFSGLGVGEIVHIRNISVKALPANFNPLLQATAGSRPSATEGLTLNGVDDFMSMAFPGGAGSADMDVLFATKTTDTSFIPISDLDGSVAYLGSSINDTNTTINTNAGTNSFYVDDVEFVSGTNTRGEVSDAIADGIWHRAEARSADFTAWSGVIFGKYASGFHLAGAISAAVVIDRADFSTAVANEIRALAQEWIDGDPSPGFVLTGQSATLTRGKPLAAEAGSFTLSGQTAGIVSSRSLTADAAAITVAGQAAALSAGYTVAAGVGAFALTGLAAGLVVQAETPDGRTFTVPASKLSGRTFTVPAATLAGRTYTT